MAKKTKLFTLEFDYSVAGAIEFTHRHVSKFNKESKTTKLLTYGFKPTPLSKKWSAVSVVKEKGPRVDVYCLNNTRFAVSKKVKNAVEKKMGDTVEFLPLKVVGEMRENADFETVCKLKPSKEELYVFHPTTKVKMAVGTTSTDHPACREYFDFAFRADDISDLLLFRPPQSSPQQTLVSQEFRDVMKSKNIKGFSFKKVTWKDSEQLATKKRGARTLSHVAVKSRGAEKAKTIAKPKASDKVVAPRTPPSTGHYTAMTKRFWEMLEENWQWVCDASVRMSEDKPRRPKISKPLSQTQVDKIKKKVDLPREFENVLLKFSSKVDFFWGIEPDEHPMPESIEACTFGGGPLWDAKLIPEMAKIAAEYESSEWRLFREGLKGRLPFLHVGNGDLVAFCMRKGNKNCPVVYLSHDDDRDHNRQIGVNFVDFIMNWSFVGCVDLDTCFWEPFYSNPKKKIHGLGRPAMEWRKFMENGK